MKPHFHSRRSFLKGSLAGLGALALPFPFVSARNILGANSRLNIAGVGVGGKGWTDITSCDSENIIGVCDVDSVRLGKAGEKYAQAKRFADWRVMYDKLGKQIDAVTVSTPDHMHFHPAYRAIREGKHVFCQKPLTHTVWEARTLAAAARRAKVATQMGNQGISHPQLRRDAELLRAGVLGSIREIHCWTDRPGKWWKQGLKRPSEFPAVPSTLDWNLWLGATQEHPYHPQWAHFLWRGWWDFGTGASGDMGCHLLNLPTLAMELRDPVHIDARGEGQTDVAGPVWSEITWQFPARGAQAPFKLYWYDGGHRAPQDLFPGSTFDDNGIVVVGSKDVYYSPSHLGGGKFKSGATYEDFKHIPESLPKGQNWDRCHYEEWIQACKGGAQPLSNFSVSGPVSEVMLLGQVALRARHPLEWNAKRLVVTNHKEANQYIRKHYRKGWEV